MSNKNQDKIFYKSEGDKYFERNGPRINKNILKAVKFLKPKSNSNILEIGCMCGSTLKKINTIFKSNVFGVDTSRDAINFAKKKNNLKNMFHNTFISFKIKKKFDIIICGGFLCVTPNHLLKKNIKKIFRLMKNNSYLIVWDYDTPYSYINNYKHDKNIKSYKRDLLKEINKIDNKNYLVSKKLYMKNSKISSYTYNNKKNIDNITAVMIFKRIL
jgi:cyclopropane fatty-acyl-phospholipid synthase-like methyltransferase